jgi:hypothetical protein
MSILAKQASSPAIDALIQTRSSPPQAGFFPSKDAKF